jgi:subtilisin family serine protease
VLRESACGPDDPCTVEITTHAALPRFDNPATMNDGPASFGTRSDLAAAITRAVTTHLQGPDPARLIVNISAGWDASTGCTTAPLPADVQEVHQALALAHCSGALVFVATGNQRLPGVESDGPLCPARWETEPTPDPVVCQSLLTSAGLSPRSSGRTNPRPFLTAVSGLADDDTPMANALPHSLAQLASRSRGPDDDPKAPHGTSFATARVSGLAAAIWSRRPEWSPAEVLQHLHDVGTPLALRSDFGVDAPQQVRRIDRAILAPNDCAATE